MAAIVCQLTDNLHSHRWLANANHPSHHSNSPINANALNQQVNQRITTIKKIPSNRSFIPPSRVITQHYRLCNRCMVMSACIYNATTIVWNWPRNLIRKIFLRNQYYATWLELYTTIDCHHPISMGGY